jgi:hypothetical protein
VRERLLFDLRANPNPRLDDDLMMDALEGGAARRRELLERAITANYVCDSINSHISEM